MLKIMVLFLSIFHFFLNPMLLFSKVKYSSIEEEIKLIEKNLKEIKRVQVKKEYIYNKTKNELSKLMNLYIFLKSNEGKILNVEGRSNKHLIRGLMEFRLKIYQNIKIDLSKKEEQKQMLYAKLTKLKELYAKRKERGSHENRPSKVKIMDNRIINPITIKKANEGQHRIILKEKRRVYAPISGIVDKIIFTQGVLGLKIKNEKCSSYVWGLSILTVSPGQNVKVGELIGETEEPLEKDFQFVYEVSCQR